ncbi:MAG: S9 family peptidase [Acidobacteriaceae bacterium]
MNIQRFRSAGMLALAAGVVLSFSVASAQSSKPVITLEEYMNGVDIHGARLSPSGDAAVIGTVAPDWKHSRYVYDLWLWKPQQGTTMLTQSGKDSEAQWSPDGKYIAFLSDRDTAGIQAAGDDDKDAADKDKPGRVWVMRADGGEAFPLYVEPLDAHSFSWSPDSKSIYFSAETPLTKAQTDEIKKDWKDVIRWREQERGDLLLKIPVADAMAANKTVPLPYDDVKQEKSIADTALPLPKDASIVTRSPYRIAQLLAAPAGEQIVFRTDSVSERDERTATNEIYLVSTSGAKEVAAKQLTHNQGRESDLGWSPDGKLIYFLVPAAGGSVEGPYEDVEGRIYSLDPASGHITRLGSDYTGSWAGYAVQPDGSLLAEGQTGVETQIYSVKGDHSKKLAGLAGTYGTLGSALHGKAVILTYSTIQKPTEVYVAPDAEHLAEAKSISSFNQFYTKYAVPDWSPFQWKSEDGRTIEGVLEYPPGKKGAKNLPMMMLIHGGPADADGNRFGADWYDWASYAAEHGWLVFRPNYRGSTGYGDSFMLEIQKNIVSLPGKDIMTGVDALVKQGIADPNHMAIAGYSYGGYMTNWLITQTTRFKVALTGAGAVEHAANWGNDDMTFDDAWMLNGTPWQQPKLYQSEAALFQMDKVKTPVHLVGGGSDVRVSTMEDILLERALDNLGIPHTFLMFPGEGHGLGINPWHGYIKVRDEWKWLEKYAAK